MKLILALLLIYFISINSKDNLRDKSANDTDSSFLNDIIEDYINNLGSVVDKMIEIDFDEDQLTEEDLMLDDEDLNKIKEMFLELEDKMEVEDINEENDIIMKEDNEDQSLWPETPEPQYKFIF